MGLFDFLRGKKTAESSDADASQTVPRTVGRLGCIIVAAALAQACGNASTDGGVTRRTVGDTTFVSSPADGTEGPVRLEEALRVGASASDLGRIDAGAFGPDGTIWLLDGATRDGARIVILDSLGAARGQAGRQGAGPGEYRTPLQIFRLANRSMLAKEMRTTRAVRFAADGQVVATLALPPEVATGWVVTPDLHGGWFITALFEPNTPTRVGRFGWFHFDSAGVVRDTVHPPAQLLTESTPDGITPGRIRTIGSDGSVLTTVPGPNRMTRVAPDGTVLVTEWPGLPPEYGTDERNDIQAVVDRLNGLLGKPLRPLPERKQPVHRIQTDGTGTVWAQLSAPGKRIPEQLLPPNPDPLQMKWYDPDRWAAFGADGAMRFIVDLPTDHRLLDRDGNRLLCVATDTEGEEHIVILRIVRAGER